MAIRWEGARAPTIWTVPAPEIEPADACRELARRYLHVFGPTTADGFARWAGISRRAGADAFAALAGSLLSVRSPLGEELLLADDEPEMRAAETAPAPALLLPSGDAYFLLDGAERELLVPRADRRELLWTSRVWPGALLVDGEIRGTWRRAQHTVRIDAWGRPSRVVRDAVEAEAAALPLPRLDRAIDVVWKPKAGRQRLTTRRAAAGAGRRATAAWSTPAPEHFARGRVALTPSDLWHGQPGGCSPDTWGHDPIAPSGLAVNQGR